MKRTIKNLAVILMMVIVFCFIAVQASAADVSDLTFANCDGGVMVTSCKTTASGNLTIPSKHNGSKVVKIADNAFNNCTVLENVTISEGVTVIGSSAFEGCTRLVSITLPETIETIESYAFFGCDALVTLVMYPAVTEIGEYAFYDCAALRSIAIPEKITTIKESTFGQCTALSTVFIPNTVKTVEANAFLGCDIKYVYYSASMFAWNNISWTEGNDSISKKADAIKYDHHHNHVSNVYVQPTCKEKGKASYVCECGNSYKDAVAALGHKSVEIPGIAATCTEPGKTSGLKCSVCDYVIATPSNIPARDHTKVVEEAVQPTCKKVGYTRHVYCKYCDKVFEKKETVAKIAHKYEYKNTKKATTTADGTRQGTCSLCGTQVDKTIAKVSSITLSTSKCTYNGKVRTTTVTVKDSSGNELVKDTDYTVSDPSNKKDPGIYKIKVTLKGKYSGSKTLKFTIVPGKTANIKSTATKTTATKLTWDKVTGATGYKVYIYKTTDGTTKKVAATVTTNSYTLTKDYAAKSLKMGTKYKVEIFALTKTSDGTEIVATSGVAYTFKFVPPTPTLKVTSTVKGRATLSWNDVAGETGYQVYWSEDGGKTYKKLATYTGWPDTQYKKGLTTGKTYYFKVRAYTKVGSENIYGSYSAVKSIKIK